MRRFTAIAVVTLFLASCASPQPAYVKDGEQYGVTKGLFRDRWWNYYERGLSFSEGEFYQEAMKDLKKAVAKRQADQWRARTYGMHFVDYFPHRELGIVYFRVNRYEEAVGELELSLETAESAKAKYFLNRARKSLLEKTGKDALPPTLHVASTDEDAVTNKFFIELSGVAEDDHFVSAVRVNGSPLPLELSAERFAFKTEVNLREGPNQMRVVAEDLLDRTTEMVLTITADRRGPLICVEDMQTDGPTARVIGFVTDETGIDSLSVNGKPLASSPRKEVSFDRVVAYGKVRIEARDLAGNATVANISLAEEAFAPSEGPRLACLETVPTRSTSGAAEGMAGPCLVALGLGGLRDTSAPVIELEGLADLQDLYDESVLIEGSVSDDTRIESLTVNGEQVLRTPGRRVFFSHLKRLQVGENAFHIEARDSSGNSASRDLTVRRKVQKVRQIGSRMSLAVLPLERKGDSSVIGDAVYDSLLSALVNQRRFNIVEREQMEEVLRELKLSSTDLVDPTKASKMGHILAADAMLSGTVLESEHQIEIIARMIDTESSVVLSSNDVFEEEKSLPAVARLMEMLAYKFKRDLPLLEGLIIEAKESEVLVDLGEEAKLRRHCKLILFREGPAIRHPLTGRMLGSETLELAEARVKAVFEDFSRATVTRKTAAPKVMDRAITK